MSRKYTHKHFGEDIVFSNVISDSSVTNLIELFEKHSYLADSYFKKGAMHSNPESILKGHIHHAISQTLICALNQIENKNDECMFNQDVADDYAQNLMTYNHEDYSMILRT